MSLTMVVAFLYMLLVLFVITKYFDHSEKKHKKTWRRMVGKFPRPPGHHLAEKISDRNFTLTGMMLGFAFCPIFIFGVTPNIGALAGWLLTFITQGVILWKLIPTISQHQNDKKGMMAEIKVGMALSSKLPNSCSVYHDVQLAEEGCHGANADHVVVTPHEIYLIDTKYRRAAKEADTNELFYDGSRIRLGKDGYASDQDLQSIQSVKQQLVNYLQREGGIKVDIPIHCVLIYPGWKVDFTEAMGKNAPVQVSATTALINRLIKKHSCTSIVEGSTADRIDQLLDAKNVVRLEKF